MTSYLNMPLGMFGSTMNNNVNTNNSRQGGTTTGAAAANYKLNFIPQTTSKDFHH